jgi:hypothetical protein
MTRNINFSAVGFTSGYIIIAVYVDDTLGTLVDSKSYLATSATNVNATFTTLSNQPYYVVIYHNSVNAVGGTIRNFFWFDATVTGSIVRDDLFLTADSTTGFASASGVGNCFYTDSTLIGWKFEIERRGFGTMQPDAEYSYDDTIGKWLLLPTLDTPTPSIQPGEIFIIKFQPQLVTTTGPSSSAAGVMFDDCFDVTADITLDNSYMGKCGLIAGASDHLTVTLPLLSSVVNNKMIGFISEGGSHINATIQAAGTDTIKFLNGLPTKAIMGQSEFITLFKKNGVWNVGPREGNYKTVGEIFNSYSKDDSVILNAVFANGQALSRATYPRLYNHMLQLDSSEVVNDTNWNNNSLNNKGKWSTGDGSTTFRVPLLYKTVDGSNNILSSGFLEGADGTIRKAGSLDPTQMIDHRHSQTIGTLPTSIWSRLLTSLMAGITQIGNYYRTGSNTGTDLTSSPCKIDGSAFLTAGNENKPASTSIYKMIRI